MLQIMQKGMRTSGTSTENLLEETYGHINNAFCDGMTTTITAAHRDICMPACKLHKHQGVGSGMSHLIKGVV